jgi:hypothetical protein
MIASSIIGAEGEMNSDLSHSLVWEVLILKVVTKVASEPIQIPLG